LGESVRMTIMLERSGNVERFALNLQGELCLFLGPHTVRGYSQSCDETEGGHGSRTPAQTQASRVVLRFAVGWGSRLAI